MKKFFLILYIIAGLQVHAGDAGQGRGLKSFAEKNPGAFKDAVKLCMEFKFMMIKLGYTDCDFALAVVFPELMRYSTYRDEIEAFATEIAYSASLDFEGFSIGHFQIKPVFAETVEDFVANNPRLKKKYAVIDYGGNTSTITQRRNRIRRLQNPETEIAYLFAFIDICKTRLSLKDDDTLNNLWLVASAYNAGFCYKREILEKTGKTDSFPNGSGKTPAWNYAQIAVDFYRLSNASKK